jgi:hypothetical protein
LLLALHNPLLLLLLLLFSLLWLLLLSLHLLWCGESSTPSTSHLLLLPLLLLLYLPVVGEQHFLDHTHKLALYK